MSETPHRNRLRWLAWLAPGAGPLRRYLLLWLLVPQLVLWLGAAVLSYTVAARYANLALDRSLYQASRALARQVKPMGSGLLIDFPKAARDIIETDPDDRVYYMVSSPPGQLILGNQRLPEPPPEVSSPNGLGPVLDKPRFYDAMLKEREGAVQVRVVALYLAWGEADAPQTMLVQLAKSRIGRDTLATQILHDTALPLTGLVLLMSLIVWASLRAGLAPLARLHQAVISRAPSHLDPIQLGRAPEEVQALTAALNKLLQAVRESVGQQQRFISDAAHQLRTPLAGLKSQTELALREATDPSLRARLTLVHESATRSAHLVTQLLTLARAEPESSHVMARSPFDLRRLAEELTAELVPRALQAGVDLGWAEDDPGLAGEAPLRVIGHALLVREALSNVIDNAIRYAGRGAEVTVRVRAEDGQAVVEVDDTGPGIALAQREAVFERFYRGTQEGLGCGLGLPIVKEIIERHAGTVTLLDRPPHGLRVRVRLPLAARV